MKHQAAMHILENLTQILILTAKMILKYFTNTIFLMNQILHSERLSNLNPSESN